MSPKLRKILITVVVVLVVGIVAIVLIPIFGKMSTTTVYDLRLIDAETEKEIFQKDVYLTATSQNNFDIKLKNLSSSIIEYKVISSDTSVASLEKIENIYKVTYHKAGSAVISVTCEKTGKISDEFVINVRENIPTNFVITDDKAIDDDEINIYADNTEYMYDFKATIGNEDSLINLNSMSVLQTYNTDVFDKIEIDDVNSKLIIKAKQTSRTFREYITIQTKYNDNNNEIVVNNFTILVNVKGNYISSIQLLLSNMPDFKGTTNVFGAGLLFDGEKKVDNVYLTNDVNRIYVKVRAVYTNGTVKEITQETTSETTTQGTARCSKPSIGNYHDIIFYKTAVIKFSYNSYEYLFNFIYISPDDNLVEYNNFYENKLYKKVTIDGVTTYTYIYWDTRYLRHDTITNEKGEIIGFIGGNPDCIG